MDSADDGDAFRAGEILLHATSIVSAYVRHNSVPSSELSAMIKGVYATLSGLNGAQGADKIGVHKPAIAIRKSVTDDFIICLEDGRKLKMLKRYLRSRYALTPDEYRAKWGLPLDYPMVAPSYAARRSEFAKQIGLGKRPAKKRRR